MSEWQPIMTAPMDGTEVLVRRMYKGRCLFHGISSFGKCLPQADGYIANGGGETWRTVDKIKIFPSPTHWKPIPPEEHNSQEMYNPL